MPHVGARCSRSRSSRYEQVPLPLARAGLSARSAAPVRAVQWPAVLHLPGHGLVVLRMRPRPPVRPPAGRALVRLAPAGRLAAGFGGAPLGVVAGPTLRRASFGIGSRVAAHICTPSLPTQQKKLPKCKHSFFCVGKGHTPLRQPLASLFSSG